MGALEPQGPGRLPPAQKSRSARPSCSQGRPEGPKVAETPHLECPWLDGEAQPAFCGGHPSDTPTREKWRAWIPLVGGNPAARHPFPSLRSDLIWGAAGPPGPEGWPWTVGCPPPHPPGKSGERRFSQGGTPRPPASPLPNLPGEENGSLVTACATQGVGLHTISEPGGLLRGPGRVEARPGVGLGGARP